jgi:hypothetical protein
VYPLLRIAIPFVVPYDVLPLPRAPSFVNGKWQVLDGEPRPIVDFYVTTDEGASWARCPKEMRWGEPWAGPMGEHGRCVGLHVGFNLPKEGVIYGLSYVVRGRGDPPRPGDPPQVRVAASVPKLEAELYAAVTDAVRRDCLVLTWKANGGELAPNPVTLEWSPKVDGPWSLIGEAEMPNTGRFLWQVEDTVPAKVYLRLTVRDKAGNVAVAQTLQPVLIDVIPDDRNFHILVIPPR